MLFLSPRFCCFRRCHITNIFVVVLVFVLVPTLPVFVKVHASDGGGVSVEGVDAVAGVGIPDLEGAIGATAHDDVA